jgi:hypothetical protein
MGILLDGFETISRTNVYDFLPVQSEELASHPSKSARQNHFQPRERMNSFLWFGTGSDVWVLGWVLYAFLN